MKYLKFFIGILCISVIIIVYICCINIVNNNKIINNKNLIINELQKAKKVKVIIKTNNYNTDLLIKSIKNLNSNIDPLITKQIVKSSIKYGKLYKIQPLLILCIINEESSFNPTATNKSGAIGLMQIIPKYHNDKIKKLKHNQLFFIDNNISIGTQIFKDYLIKNKNISDTLKKYVGASIKKHAKNYIDNILSNYTTLEIKYFLN